MSPIKLSLTAKNSDVVTGGLIMKNDRGSEAPSQKSHVVASGSELGSFCSKNSCIAELKNG